MSVEWGLFERIEAMSAEVFRRWYAECYQDNRANQLLADLESSVVILSPPGAGLSTALALVPLQGVLAYAYPPSSWPEQAGAFTAAKSHFDQWMGHVAYQLCRRLEGRPEAIAELDEPSHEFLVWLSQRYRGARQRDQWLRTLRGRLPEPSLAALRARADDPEFAAYYGDTGSDIATQVDECLMIASALGLRGIFATIDAGWADWTRLGADDRAALGASLRLLLSTLTPLQRPGFGIKVVLSTSLGLTLDELQRLLRGRAMILRWEWSEHEVRALLARYVRAATAGQVDPAPWLEAYWPQLCGDIAAIWGVPGPAAAVAIARELVKLAGAAPDHAGLQTLRGNLYRQAAPIYLDPVPELRTVWRGQQPIVLDETPFRLLTALWNNRGRKTENQHLLTIAGTPANLDQTIKRIRQRLEPISTRSSYLYLHRERSSYTWLEHYRLFE